MDLIQRIEAAVAVDDFIVTIDSPHSQRKNYPMGSEWTR
jgi:hypothetical protein